MTSEATEATGPEAGAALPSPRSSSSHASNSGAGLLSGLTAGRQSSPSEFAGTPDRSDASPQRSLSSSFQQPSSSGAQIASLLGIGRIKNPAVSKSQNVTKPYPVSTTKDTARSTSTVITIDDEDDDEFGNVLIIDDDSVDWNHVEQEAIRQSQNRSSPSKLSAAMNRKGKLGRTEVSPNLDDDTLDDLIVDWDKVEEEAIKTSQSRSSPARTSSSTSRMKQFGRHGMSSQPSKPDIIRGSSSKRPNQTPSSSYLLEDDITIIENYSSQPIYASPQASPAVNATSRPKTRPQIARRGGSSTRMSSSRQSISASGETDISSSSSTEEDLSPPSPRQNARQISRRGIPLRKNSSWRTCSASEKESSSSPSPSSNQGNVSPTLPSQEPQSANRGLVSVPAKFRYSPSKASPVTSKSNKNHRIEANHKNIFTIPSSPEGDGNPISDIKPVGKEMPTKLSGTDRPLRKALTPIDISSSPGGSDKPKSGESTPKASKLSPDRTSSVEVMEEDQDMRLRENETGRMEDISPNSSTPTIHPSRQDNVNGTVKYTLDEDSDNTVEDEIQLKKLLQSTTSPLSVGHSHILNRPGTTSQSLASSSHTVPQVGQNQETGQTESPTREVTGFNLFIPLEIPRRNTVSPTDGPTSTLETAIGPTGLAITPREQQASPTEEAFEPMKEVIDPQKKAISIGAEAMNYTVGVLEKEAAEPNRPNALTPLNQASSSTPVVTKTINDLRANNELSLSTLSNLSDLSELPAFLPSNRSSRVQSPRHPFSSTTYSDQMAASSLRYRIRSGPESEPPSSPLSSLSPSPERSSKRRRFFVEIPIVKRRLEDKFGDSESETKVGINEEKIVNPIQGDDDLPAVPSIIGRPPFSFSLLQSNKLEEEREPDSNDVTAANAPDINLEVGPPAVSSLSDVYSEEEEEEADEDLLAAALARAAARKAAGVSHMQSALISATPALPVPNNIQTPPMGTSSTLDTPTLYSLRSQKSRVAGNTSVFTPDKVASTIRAKRQKIVNVLGIDLSSLSSNTRGKLGLASLSRLHADKASRRSTVKLNLSEALMDTWDGLSDNDEVNTAANSTRVSTPLGNLNDLTLDKIDNLVSAAAAIVGDKEDDVSSPEKAEAKLRANEIVAVLKEDIDREDADMDMKNDQSKGVDSVWRTNVNRHCGDEMSSPVTAESSKTAEKTSSFQQVLPSFSSWDILMGSKLERLRSLRDMAERSFVSWVHMPNSTVMNLEQERLRMNACINQYAQIELAYPREASVPILEHIHFATAMSRLGVRTECILPKVSIFNAEEQKTRHLLAQLDAISLERVPPMRDCLDGLSRVMQVIYDVARSSLSTYKAEDLCLLIFACVRISVDETASAVRNVVERALGVLADVGEEDGFCGEIIQRLYTCFIHEFHGSGAQTKMEVLRVLPFTSHCSKTLRRWLAWGFLVSFSEALTIVRTIPSELKEVHFPPANLFDYLSNLLDLSKTGPFQISREMDDRELYYSVMILYVAFSDLSPSLYDVRPQRTIKALRDAENSLNYIDSKIRTDIRAGNPERNKAKNAITRLSHSIAYQVRTQQRETKTSSLTSAEGEDAVDASPRTPLRFENGEAQTKLRFRILEPKPCAS